MLNDNNDILGAAINVLDYRLGMTPNDPQPTSPFSSDGYLVTDTGDFLVTDTGDKLTYFE